MECANRMRSGSLGKTAAHIHALGEAESDGMGDGEAVSEVEGDSLAEADGEAE